MDIYSTLYITDLFTYSDLLKHFLDKRLKYPNSAQSAPPGTCKVLDGDLGHLKLADSLMNE